MHMLTRHDHVCLYTCRYVDMLYFKLSSSWGCHLRLFINVFAYMYRLYATSLMTPECFAAHRMADTMEDSSTSTNVQALAASAGYINAVRMSWCISSCVDVFVLARHACPCTCPCAGRPHGSNCLGWSSPSHLLTFSPSLVRDMSSKTCTKYIRIISPALCIRCVVKLHKQLGSLRICRYLTVTS
jgi:hypothetical protein